MFKGSLWMQALLNGYALSKVQQSVGRNCLNGLYIFSL